MVILSEKVVITRKRHECNACGRMFEAGTSMFTQVNVNDGIQTYRECPTCSELIARYPSYFQDEFDHTIPAYIVHDNCMEFKVNTPEELLDYLNKRKIVKL